jgi:diacylglycerol O-acyltransferase-1
MSSVMYISRPQKSVLHHRRKSLSTSVNVIEPKQPQTIQQSDNKPQKKLSEQTTKFLPHYKPVHVKSSVSILSLSRHGPSPSYAGFRHLAMIVLTAGNLRLMVDDYRKYGFIMTLYRLGFSAQDLKMAALLIASAPIHLLIALLIERIASKTAGHIKSAPHKPRHLWRVFAFLHTINALLALSVTSLAVFNNIWHPLIGSFCECHSIVLCLKVSSYALTNRDLRDAYVDNIPVPDLYSCSQYPTNLTLNNLVYFWWAPTLVYQPEYPRAPSIRLGFLLNRVLEMLGTAVLIWFLSGQFAIPILENSLVSFQQRDLWKVMENLMQLSTVSIIIWLLGFFFIFQSYLNFLAELLQFGDRDFYQDWWNSGSVGTYWRLWNKPVSNYFRRHFYVPLLKRGWSPIKSSFVVFFISAVLHEICVGIPTRNIIGVAFACMVLQVPLVLITAPLEKMRGPATTVGNCIFWLSFFLGQPTAVLMYYFAWNLKNGAVSWDIVSQQRG